MGVVANIAVNLDASKALAGLKGLDGAVKGLGDGVSKVGKAMTGLAGIAASIGAGAAVSGFVKAGVEADRTAKKIAALSGQYKETAQLNAVAAKAADQFGIGQTRAAQAVSDLYGRLRPMGVSLKDIDTTFTGVNKAAALMNLTTADTEGVMLQLSQAMGSGKLQGDELRSVMERLPAVGQAVANVMGVSVGEIKELGAQGKITTDVIIKAMDELNKIQPPPPDAYKLFQKAIEDLNTAIGTQLLPIFTPLVQKLTEVVTKFQELGVGATIADSLAPLADIFIKMLEAFVQMPEPLQSFIIQIGAIGGAFALIAAPLGIFLQGLGSILQFLPQIVPFFLNIGKAIMGLGPILGTVAKLLVGFFSGPVGWITLAVAAGIAIYAFRDKIAEAFQPAIQWVKDLAGGFGILLAEAGKAAQGITQWFGEKFGALFEIIKKPFADGWLWIQENFLTPIQNAIPQAVEFIKGAWANMQQIISSPFVAAINIVRGAINSMIGVVEAGINGAVGAINRLIKGANNIASRVGLPQIPLLQNVSLPRFADGGVVNGPTLAMVGEGGEPEYIVPQSKAAGFAQNWISGKRGIGAIPGFAEGGMVMPSANVSIQTGPVTQMNGTNFVTTQDLSRAVQASVNQTLSLIAGDGSVRRQLGLA